MILTRITYFFFGQFQKDNSKNSKIDVTKMLLIICFQLLHRKITWWNFHKSCFRKCCVKQNKITSMPNILIESKQDTISSKMSMFCRLYYVLGINILGEKLFLWKNKLLTSNFLKLDIFIIPGYKQNVDTFCK